MEKQASVDRIDEQREIALIDEARVDVRAGRIVTHKAVKAWVDSLDTSAELPAPRPNGRATP